MTKDRESRIANRRGVAMAFVALVLFILLGMAALAIDLGMLYGARTEAQRVADAAALAGASSLLDVPGNEDRARELAIEYGARNDVRNQGTVIQPGDVDVELWRDRVRVRAIRNAARGTALANIFAGALGFGSSDIAAVAAAEAAVASGTNCLLPFVLVDRWWETNAGRLANQGDAFNAGDIYNEGPLAAMPGGPGLNTGYGTPDRGMILRIYPGSTGDAPQPGWYYPIDLDRPGANPYRDAISDCLDPDLIISLGQELPIEPGRMVGPTDQGFNNLINSDPTAYWATTGSDVPPGGCVKRTGETGCVSNSTRVRPMVLISPLEQPTSPGKQNIIVRNFVGVFVICQGVLQPNQQTCSSGQGNNPNSGVWVRFVDYRGVNAMSPDEAPPGSFIRTLRLVE